MATIITRLYQNEAAANTVVSDLKAEGFPDRSITMISGSDDLSGRLKAAEVSEDAAAAYEAKIKDGGTLVAVKALLGWADTAVKTVNRHPAVDAGVANENRYVPTTYTKDMSKLIDKDHALIMTSKDEVASDSPYVRRYGDFLVPLLSGRTPPGHAVYSGTKRFGDFLMPLLSNRKPVGKTVYEGTKRFGDFLVPLLSNRVPAGKSVYHGTKRFGDFLVPLILRRDGSYAPD